MDEIPQEIRRFDLAPCAERELRELRNSLDVSDALAQVLVRRGLADPERARAFLAADEQHPPSAFAGIERPIETILAHTRRGERITVHGDYDVDGICSTAVLVRVLRALGANVDWYLPDRATDGYGLNAVTVRRLAERGTRLLVTVDCAVTAVAEARLAKSLGMEVIVTDHHSPRADGALPDAAIVHPALCGYPCAELCATAVAHKLALGLWEAAGGARPPGAPAPRAPLDYHPDRDLDLVALATIADVVPLLGENRALARRGLRALAGTSKPGLRALMAVARISDPAKVGERVVGFALAPRLNAAGRLYRADAGLELILTEDGARAQQIAAELDRANHERRHVEQRILFDAEQQLEQLRRSPRGERGGYVLVGEGWHPGVIGIVASRLAERHQRPFVLVALEGESGRGSGRSVEGFDLLGALESCAGHLAGYGGHRARRGAGGPQGASGGLRGGIRGARRGGARGAAARARRARGCDRAGRGAEHRPGGGAGAARALRSARTPPSRCWCGARGSPRIGAGWGKGVTFASRCARGLPARGRSRSGRERGCRCPTASRRMRRSRWRSTSGAA